MAPDALPIADDPLPDNVPFGLAILRPERTGLPFVVSISQQGSARHGVRVKVARGPRVRPEETAPAASAQPPPASSSASDWFDGMVDNVFPPAHLPASASKVTRSVGTAAEDFAKNATGGADDAMAALTSLFGGGNVCRSAPASSGVSVAVRPMPHVISPGDLDQTELALVMRWIEINRDVLIQYGDGDIAYTDDAIGAIQPIGDVRYGP